MTTPVPRERTTSQELLRQLVLLLANVTVITALLVFFGWKRASVQAAALGVDEVIFGMSTQDYVLRSVMQVVWLLLGLAMVGLMWLWLDRRLVALVPTRSWARFLPWAAVVLGVLLIIPALVPFLTGYAVTNADVYVLLPAAATAGVLLLLYSGRLWGLRRSGAVSGYSTLTQFFTFLLVAAGLFWTTSNYAEVRGMELAAQYQSYVTVDVTVTSDKPLHFNEPGVTESALDGQTFRYTGLKLLDRFGDKVFLVSSSWSPGRGKVIVLTEQEGLRFSYGS